MSGVGILVGNNLFWLWETLMNTERALGGVVHPTKIEEMGRELTKVIEDFGRAVNVEALRLAKETSKHSLTSI